MTCRSKCRPLNRSASAGFIHAIIPVQPIRQFAPEPSTTRSHGQGRVVLRVPSVNQTFQRRALYLAGAEDGPVESGGSAGRVFLTLGVVSGGSTFRVPRGGFTMGGCSAALCRGRVGTI